MPRESFRGDLPADRLYDPATDMWVAPQPDGSVTVGATAFGLWLAGELIAFTAKPRGAEVAADRGLATVETSKTVVAIHSPLALRLTEINEAAEARPAVINADPYGAGWLVRGAPADWAADARRLVDAAGYRAHCLRLEPAATVEIR